MKQKKKKIARVITIWLLVIVLASCVLFAVLTYLALSRRSERNTMALVRQNVEDVSVDIDEMTDLAISNYLGYFFEDDSITSADIENPDELNKELQDFYKGTGIELNIVDKNGIIIVSSVPEYVGYDMHDGEQASEFLVLLDGDQEEYIQDMREVSYDDATMMKYAGRRFPDGSGFLEVGLSYDVYYDTINSEASIETTNRRIGENGYLLICDEDGLILNTFHDIHTGQNLSDAGIEIEPGKTYSFVDLKCKVFGVPSYVNINEVKGTYVIGVYPVREAITDVNTMLLAAMTLEVVVFAVLFVTLIILLRKVIVGNMEKVNNALAQITDGNLEERIEVRDTYEFDMLSTDINATVDKLKDYIEEAEARINEDLEIAKEIQISVLPADFPICKEFELFASMKAAKEVGGDFYDFFLLGTDILGFLVADVSGKSIPGAMFMMRGKTLIKSLAQSGLPPEEVFNIANAKLCEGNEADLFITAWMGYLQLSTGTVYVANAGHNPPVLIRDGKAEFIKVPPGFMLAGDDETIYKGNTIQLNSGDILYLYTDGVTEAMDPQENLYGDDRLIDLLSFKDEYPKPTSKDGVAEAVCDLVAKDLNAFVKGAEQSDDITMLCLRYLGAKQPSSDSKGSDHKEFARELNLEATRENVDTATEFVDEILNEIECPAETLAAIEVAVDELFSNIANYAYGEEGGPATIRVRVSDEPASVEITFIDEGVQYDPMAKPDPDTTQSIEDMPIGGMGIFIVKQSMDDVHYEYSDGKNIMTIKKNL